jgi:beta-galactosidase/beta-glucuronidase
LSLTLAEGARLATAHEATLPLAGTWTFRLDPEDVGVSEEWFAREFDDTVQLPGTTDEVAYRDERTVNFGIRRFATRRNQFTINGRPVFLRDDCMSCTLVTTMLDGLIRKYKLELRDVAPGSSIPS